MSEFSESYHLKTASQDEAAALLEHAGFPGAVFAPSGIWTTVVPWAGLFEAMKPMAEANEGILLHYVFAEDHCWHATLYDGPQIAWEYLCSWDADSPQEHGTPMNPGPIEEVIRQAGRDPSQLVDALPNLDQRSINYQIGWQAADRFTELVGLKHFRDICGTFILDDEEDLMQQYPGVRIVCDD